MAYNEIIDIIARDRTTEGVASAQKTLQGVQSKAVGIYAVTNIDQVAADVKRGMQSLNGTGATAQVKVLLQDSASPQLMRIWSQLAQMPNALSITGSFNGDEILKGLMDIIKQGGTAADVFKRLNQVKESFNNKDGKKSGAYAMASNFVDGAKNSLELDKQLASFKARIDTYNASLSKFDDKSRTDIIRSSQYQSMMGLYSRMRDAQYRDADYTKAILTEYGKNKEAMFRNVGKMIPNNKLFETYGVNTHNELKKAESTLKRYENWSNKSIERVAAEYNKGKGSVAERLTRILNGSSKEIFDAWSRANNKRAKHNGNISTGVNLLNPNHITTVANTMASLGRAIDEVKKKYGHLGKEAVKDISAPYQKQLDAYNTIIKAQGALAFKTLADRRVLATSRSESRLNAAKYLDNDSLRALNDLAAQYRNALQNLFKSALPREAKMAFGRDLGAQLRTLNDARRTNDTGRMDDAVSSATPSLRRNNHLIQQSVSNQQALSSAAQRYGQELDRVNQRASLHQGMLSQIGQELVAAYSVYQLRQFLVTLVEIGGQFEYQRKSIANILGSTSKANTLFEQIKGLALKSPFSTLELDQYAKQLSAFDIEYNELFDKLKKLSDISAGTGADMSRIILAYGHVKAEGFLTGMQRRQFSNANINVVGALADLYSKQEQRTVTKRDIYKRISEKQVSSEDLDKVLMAMAEPGGKFFEMQEAMADTTKAMWKNVGDAINHMYMDLEAKNRGELQFVAKGLIEGSKLVKDIIPSFKELTFIIGAGALAWKAYGADATKAFTQVRLESQKTAAEMKAMQGMNFWSALRQGFSGGRKISSSDFQKAAMSDRMDAQQAMRHVMMGRMDNTTIEHLRNSNNVPLFTPQQIERAKALNAQLEKSNGLIRFLTIGWRGVNLGITSALGGIRAFGVALWSTLWPMLAVTAAIEGISLIWEAFTHSKAKEEEKQRVDDLRDSYQALAAAMKEVEGINIKGMSDAEATEHLIDLVTILKNEAPELEGVMNRIFAVDENGNFVKGIKEQYNEIKSLLDEYKSTKKIASDKRYDIQGIVEDAVTDGWLDDELRNVFEDFNEKVKAYGKTFTGLIDYEAEYKLLIENLAKRKTAFRNHLLEIEAISKDGKVLDLNKALEASAAYNDVLDELRKESGYLYDKTGSENVGNFIKALDEVRNKGYAIERVLPRVLSEVSIEFGKLPGLAKLSKESMERLSQTSVWDWLQKKLNLAINDVNLLRMGFDAAGAAQNRLFSGEGDKDKKDLATALHNDALLKHNNLNTYFKENAAGIETIATFSNLYKEKKDNVEKLKKVTTETEKIEYDKNLRELNALKDAASRYGIILPKESGGGSSSGRGSSKADVVLKTWQKQTDTIKNFNDAFNKLKKAKGEAFKSDDQILREMESLEEYKELLVEMNKYNFNPKKFTKSEDVVNFLAERSKNGIKGGANIDQDGRNKAISALNELLVSLRIDIAKETIDKTAKEAELYFQKKIAEWDLYIELRNLTGNDSDSKRIAQSDVRIYDEVATNLLARLGSEIRFSDKNFGDKGELGSVIDSFNKQREQDFQKRMSEAKSDEEREYLEANKPKEIAFQDIVDAKLGLAEAEQLFDGTENKFYKMYQQVFEHIQKSSTEFKKNMANAINETMSAAGKLKKLQDEKRRELNKFAKDANGKVAPEQQEGYKAVEEKFDREIRNATDALFKERSEFMEATKDLARLTTTEIQKVRDTALALLQVINKSKEDVIQDGKIAGYNYTDEDGKKTFISKESYDQLYSSVDNTSRKGSLWKRESKEGKSFERIKSWATGKKYDDGSGNSKDLKFDDVIEDISALTSLASNALGQFAGMWDALGGSEDAIDALNLAQEGLNGLNSIAQGIAQGGVVGGIIAGFGAITGLIGSLAKMHDKKLDRAIQRSKNRVNDLKYEYEQLQQTMNEGFGTQDEESLQSLESLKQQQAELQKQADLERKKKKSDKESIKEYERAEAELANQVKNYARDRAKALYGIDLKDMSQRLSDSLTEAFMNGEDAALSWRNTVGDMVRDVLKRMILLKTIEPLMEQIQKDFFEEGGKHYVGENLQNLDEDLLFERINGVVDSPLLTAVNNLVSRMESKFPENSKNSNSGNIARLESNITEQTGSLIASYTNAIRADVSLQTTIAKQQLSSLNTIVENTKRNAEAAEAIQGLFNDVTTGIKKLYVR